VALERAAIEAVDRGGDARVRCASRCYLAEALIARGDLTGAETEARIAVDLASQASTMMTLSRALVAEVLLRRNRALEADVVLEAVPQSSVESGEEGALRSLLVASEVAAALGDRERAERRIALAHERLMARAATIADEAYRTTFLESVSENARICELHDRLSQSPR